VSFRSLPVSLPLLLLAGCSGMQHALDPAGRQAQSIAQHWWFYFAVSAVVYVAVAVATLWALWRRRSEGGDDDEAEGRTTRIVLGATVVTVILLFALLFHTMWTGRTLASAPEENAVQIDVIGHQWWWEIHYRSGEMRYLTTANEMHIPTGRPVVLRLISRDVIHSFWVPNLHGKIDLIPGRQNKLVLQADRAGVYRGQCAEFCGTQHARMSFLVIAQPPEAYESWLAAQRRPAAAPATLEQQRGHDIFVSSQCAVCHTVRGTTAFGGTGPDLTHLSSRRTLAAASIPNTRGHLGGWILDPQAIKPGNRMPPNNFEPADFHALLAYLESLK
jgi:cytochrome c oxidase subunit II